jgi:hypothetical protein
MFTSSELLGEGGTEHDEVASVIGRREYSGRGDKFRHLAPNRGWESAQPTLRIDLISSLHLIDLYLVPFRAIELARFSLTTRRATKFEPT